MRRVQSSEIISSQLSLTHGILLIALWSKKKNTLNITNNKKKKWYITTNGTSMSIGIIEYRVKNVIFVLLKSIKTIF